MSFLVLAVSFLAGVVGIYEFLAEIVSKYEFLVGFVRIMTRGKKIKSKKKKLSEKANSKFFGLKKNLNFLLEKAGFQKLGSTQGELRKGGKFLLGFMVAFVVFYFASNALPLVAVELFVANVVKGILELIGFQVKLFVQEPVLMLVNEKKIIISYLCTGLLEMIVLAASIAASFGIKLEKRIFGIAAALLGTAAFNFFRIIITILIIFNFNLAIAEIAHEFLFRIFLFFVIVGIYAVWFRWATST